MKKKLFTLLALVLCTLCCMAGNKIYYTTADGKSVVMWHPETFGVNIVSNTYKNGQGVITFDGEVTMIGEFVFSGSQLVTIVIPESVTQIGENAFDDCGRNRQTLWRRS